MIVNFSKSFFVPLIFHASECFLLFRNDMFYILSFIIVELDYHCEVCLKHIKQSQEQI